MAARPFMDAQLSIDNKTATAIVQYKSIPNTIIAIVSQLPAPNDTAFALSYNSKLRSPNTPQFLANVPLKVDRHLFYTIGLVMNPCPSCLNGTQLIASLNNITIVMPQIGLLQAHYFNIKGVLRDANLLTVESRPFHLYGYNFFVVGIGIGNFDPKKDPAKFNLVDPPERNAVGVPTGGWTAIRFRADNPGWGLKTAFVVENGKGPDQSVLPPPKDLPSC
ncbi:hypothetical protein GH714_000021 [Hevea brasiliensis]|uniref:Plastocyanin-like domain-containing protein n=1 Tax=Hevea brasiliensis TaxID=3981 RepID=A0A6A6M6V6_HEVBR|nr:hypothetical protein GH714_000021 [Hevea brasiliensis]